MLKEKFVNYINEGIRKNWNIGALTDYKGESFTYAEVAAFIASIHTLYKKAGIRRGDKVALVGRNSARWCIVYLATVTYGGIIVPILPDFMPDDIQEIVNHSDSVLLFCSDTIFESLKKAKMPKVSCVLSVNSYELIRTDDTKLEKTIRETDIAHPAPIARDQFTPPEISNKELAVISYTSGTTGHSKGVMLSHNSLAANIRFAQEHMPLNPGDPIVSFLPLAHAYGCAFEFLFPFTIGCTVTILTKTPSPQIVMQAFQEIKPALILSVPLVIEKIYKKQIIPVISKPVMKVLLALPGLNRLILSKIRKKLVGVFGGNFTEIVIGGAAFNPEAEAFFRRMKFPYTVGYGMTECGPLISYASSMIIRPGSSGIAVDTLEVSIDSEDPRKIVGEIILRGENVMHGYYKNEEATQQIIDQEGWLHTGDLGLIDKDGFIYIKGRSKSLILGASGKNIYPEELESALNTRYCILESLVVHRDEKLVALICPDRETMQKDSVSELKLQEILKEHIQEVNKTFPKYMQVARYELVSEEFAKTPKRSIKRFLYE
jgi:long-chain acyl-CoA synthetase